AMDLGLALAGRGNTGQHLEKRALARPVQPDDADILTLVNGETGVTQRPEVLLAIRFLAVLAATKEIAGARGDQVDQRIMAAARQSEAIALAQPVYDNCSLVAHIMSANVRSCFLKWIN